MSDLSDVNEFNRGVIEQFRESGGNPGPPFEGAPLLILHSTGAKSGKVRLAPIVYRKVGDSWAVFASKAGAPNNPDWFHNLVANPKASIEVGADTIDVVARVLGDEEREPIWTEQKQVMPGFAEYEQKTDRQIPVVLLERA
ncbi:nitroreductase family deazaflavin-dependent oxidoreductase [Aquihabitans sp. McL0605]|uniref:nitroreductase family deazaflavin-dependent oxidoreductase n=1 Tax=Aquihabitans sp. McL0605 TaxID=3415671 RepID=UPI003CF10975